MGSNNRQLADPEPTPTDKPTEPFLRQHGLSCVILCILSVTVAVSMKMTTPLVPDTLLPLQNAGRDGEVKTIRRNGKTHVVLKFHKSNIEIDLGDINGRLNNWSVNHRYDVAYSIQETPGTLRSFVLFRGAGPFPNGKRLPLLPPPGGRTLRVTKISDDREIIGEFGCSDKTSNRLTRAAFFWNVSRGLTELGNLGGVRTFANDVKNGSVVGKAELPDGRYHAFLWREGQPLQDLGTLPQGVNSEAVAINGRGEIVGSGDMIDGETYALLWRDGKIINLNQQMRSRSGWHYFAAYRISEHGDIEVHAARKGDLGVLRLPSPNLADDQ